MSLATASTLVDYLMVPVLLEHLLLGGTSEQHHKVKQAEILQQLAVCCTKLQVSTPPQQEGANVQSVVDNALADHLGESQGSVCTRQS